MLPADAPRPRSPRCIVIVDDNVDAGEALAALLELDGHTVTVHHDADSALADVDAGADADAWLLDIGLPRIDGYELARRLRARRPHALLIALTGYGQADDRERSRAAGFDHHFVKPVEPEALERVLAGPSGGLSGQRGEAA
jgi:CheY-like chemotaxis protein